MTMYCTLLKGNKRRYYIGSAIGKPVAWFDDMDTAATVLRYLTGAKMTLKEVAEAHEAMRKYDSVKEGEND